MTLHVVNAVAHESTLQEFGINQRLIGQRGSRGLLATPALLLDLDALDHNLAAMAMLSRDSKLAVRPHAKTHKSLRIARLQLEHGATGICVATLREAAVMVSGGIPSVHLTSPIVDGYKCELFAQLTAKTHHISGVIDNPAALPLFEAAAERYGVRPKLLVDTDLGVMYRTGICDTRAALDLARRIQESSSCEYCGIQFYSGIVQHIPSFSERKRRYDEELRALADVVFSLTEQGLKPTVVSGGGTGTIEIDARSGLFTENQAGSFAVMDVEYSRVQISEEHGTPFRPALFVQASVVSNNLRGMATVDAGTKSFALDGPLPEIASGAPPGSTYQYFGDEFGVILSEALAQRAQSYIRPSGQSDYDYFHDLFGKHGSNVDRLPLGSRIELVAPHCDPTVNLHSYFHCVRGDTLVDIWPVDARGSL